MFCERMYQVEKKKKKMRSINRVSYILYYHINNHHFYY